MFPIYWASFWLLFSAAGATFAPSRWTPPEARRKHPASRRRAASGLKIKCKKFARLDTIQVHEWTTKPRVESPPIHPGASLYGIEHRAEKGAIQNQLPFTLQARGVFAN
jgi:hypothetical protein